MRISTQTKLLCIALSVLTALTVILNPISSAYAEGKLQGEQSFADSMLQLEDASQEDIQDQVENERFIELTDKRTEYIKYYQLESKRFEAVSFGLPVHYLEDGEYKQIDNTLELSTAENGSGKYINKANSFRVELATALSKDWTASISKEQYKISWSIIGVSNDLFTGSMPSLEPSLPTVEPTISSAPQQPTPTPSSASTLTPSMESTPEPTPEATPELSAVPSDEAVPTAGSEATASPAAVQTSTPEFTPESVLAPNLNDSMQFGAALAPSSAFASEALTRDAWNQLSKAEQRRSIPGIASDVVYKSVLPGVDLQYVVISDRIKENMILSRPMKLAQITQKMQADGLTLIKEEDGTITAIAKDTQQPVFKMQAPFMMDKEGNGCNISFDLLESNGLYYLIYNLDQKWLATAKYPVTIDPTITTSLNPADVIDTRVSSALPNNNYVSSYIMCTGNGASSGINYSLVKFNNMPVIGPSEMIVHAGFRVKRASSSSINSTVTAHQITGSWTPSTVTWNSKPSFDSSIEDYRVVDTVANKTFEWDVTRIAKSWYSGTANNGILLKDISDSGGYKEWYTSNAAYGDVPYAYFVYTNYAGLEGYWDYASSSIGRGGAANINLYNGNLVYTHSTLATTGNRMPVSITHVFNSSARDDNWLVYGYGWRTNYDQRIEYVSISGTNYYKYTDEDGTVHYFVMSGGEWKSEDGIDLKLSVGGDNTITLKDKSENKMVFFPVSDATKPGFLSYIEDANGNRQSLSYDGRHLTQITDGAGRVVKFNRNQWGYLQSIQQQVDATNYRYTVFTYDAGSRLTYIQYPDDNAMRFIYDDNGNLTSAINIDGKSTNISYQSSAPYRVVQVEERNGTELGGCLSFDYGYNRTQITDVEGRKAQYQFNDYGNTVCVIGSDGSASYTKFGNTVNGTSTNDINKIIQSSKTQKFGVNYLLNHNAEATGNWTLNSYDGSIGTHTYETDQRYFGGKSIKLSKSNTAGYEAAVQNITLEKGKTYTLSGYVKTSDVSGSSGAFLRALYNTSSGQAYLDSPILTGTNDWSRYSATFSLPSDASSANVSILLMLTSTGTAWFDALQLEDGSVINRYNLVENADFTSYAGNVPTFWVRNALSSSDTIDASADSANPSYMSDARFMISGNSTPETWKSIDQAIPVSGKAGDTYVAGGWAKGKSVPYATDPVYRVFGISVEFKYTDGTNEYAVIFFNEDSDIWQYACGAVIANKDYSSIVIRPHYSAESNTAWFDGIQLFREEFGESFSYDANGNLKTARDLQNKNEQYSYSNNDLVKYVTPDLREYTYTYDSKHNLKTAVSPGNMKFSYEYDQYGNQTEAKLGNDFDYIRTSASYTSNGNYLDTITDPFGETIDYDFDALKGTLTQVTDPYGNAVNYIYDAALDQMLEVSMTADGKTLRNNYSYYADSLTGVSHTAPNNESVGYSFRYNGLGELLETRVGSQSLVVNTLKDRTGRLEATSYGNGQAIDYAYDQYDRLTQSQQSGNSLYSYEYDNAGNVGYQRDYVNNEQVWYEYDNMQRLGKITRMKSNGDLNWSRYGFDNTNNLTSFNERIAGTDYTQSYTYDNDERLQTVNYGGYSTAFGYDTVCNRVADKSRKVNGTTVFNTSYAYAPGDGITSSLSSRVSRIWNGTKILNYSYDDHGFITQVLSEIGTNVLQYRYDAFGQLIRENYNWYGVSGTTIYTYDVGGNITSKAKYNFVDGDGSVGTPIEVISYEYGDSNWRDKLTSYNGNAITYDAIGNPLSDGRWTYTWTQGRMLQQISDSSTTAVYKYNDTGLRTEKTVNGVTTVYNISGDLITWEKTGSNAPIYYLYDNNGILWGLNYNGSVYFYVQNQQNDVVGLVDSAGALVVEYAYDAWGNILYTTGTLASTLGKDNPFRYRGYYFDHETGLFSVGSRYYNPGIGRWLSPEPNVYEGEFDEGAGMLSYNVYAYCANNPVIYYDPTGESLTLALAGAGSFAAGAAAAGGANFWNPVGWVIFGALAVCTVVWAGVKIYNYQKAKQAAALSSAKTLMNFASTAATPPPPNKGGKGTQTTSKTLYNKKGVRIDVENPGNRVGQIHLQKGGVKYYYNVAQKAFRIGSSNGQLAPRVIQELLQNSDVIKAIAKGLAILGY